MVDCATVCSGSGPPRFTIITLTTYGVRWRWRCACMCMCVFLHTRMQCALLLGCSWIHTNENKKINKQSSLRYIEYVNVHSAMILSFKCWAICLLGRSLRTLTSTRIGRVQFVRIRRIRAHWMKTRIRKLYSVPCMCAFLYLGVRVRVRAFVYP